MRRIVLCLLFLICSLESARSQEYIPLYAEKTNFVTDLALIYQGGTHRPEWNRGQLEPYVYQVPSKRKPEWLFDGFLFIEFKDNLGYEYAKGYGQKPAGKSQWSWLLERNFEPGKAIPALNSILDSMAERKIRPERRRKVVLTLPDPILGAKEWGELNGKALDFSLDTDRVAACKWFVDEAINRWKSNNLDELDLAGFYWVAEQSKGSVRILPEIAAYIRSKGFKFYWIPYWNAAGSADWREAGFDVAYQQPNHFFNEKTPDSRLSEATAFAKKNNMGLEMEFDMRVEKPEFAKRFYAYLNAFKNAKVLDQAAMAYYEGGGAVFKLARHQSEGMRKIYADLCKVIKARQKKADRVITAM